ncbi:hypothetical protein [Campylobacter sp. P0085]|uniref:hypothetical protein n=1 Tax=Campylobacter sp. P0085 TaxID=1895597 RepID=UPI000A352ADC|nr:hypothetical protein [Campylobacter sp. P0085]
MGIFWGIVFAIFILIAMFKLGKAWSFTQKVDDDIEFYIQEYIKFREELFAHSQLLPPESVEKQREKFYAECRAINRYKFAKVVKIILSRIESYFHKDDILFYLNSIIWDYHYRKGDGCFGNGVPLDGFLLGKLISDTIKNHSMNDGNILKLIR